MLPLSGSIYTSMPQVLHPNLTLGEAHQVARLVRSTLLAAPSLAWIEDVDVDLELDDRLHSDPQTEAPWRRADAVRRESSASAIKSKEGGSGIGRRPLA